MPPANQTHTGKELLCAVMSVVNFVVGVGCVIAAHDITFSVGKWAGALAVMLGIVAFYGCLIWLPSIVLCLIWRKRISVGLRRWVERILVFEGGCWGVLFTAILIATW